MSELGNPATAHYWMDYMHALRVADLPGVNLSIVNADSHAIVHGRVNLFADLLAQLASDLSAPVDRRNEIVTGVPEPDLRDMMGRTPPLERGGSPR